MRLNRDFGTISLEKEFLCAVFEGIFIVLLREIRRLLLLKLEGCTLEFFMDIRRTTHEDWKEFDVDF